MENSKLLSNIKLQRPKSATGLSKTPQGAGNVIPVKSPSVRTRPTTATGSIRSVLKSSNVSSAIPSTPTPLSPTNLSVMSGVSSSARETAKMAKLQNTAERVQKVSELKDKWVKEKEDKVSRNLERRADELKRLRDISNAASEQRRQNAERQKKIASAAKAARIENIAKSVEDRAFQQAELENQAKQRRRQSILLNTEIKAKAAENQRKIAAANKAQEDDILATRRLDYLEIKAIKKARAEQERADAASRSEAAHREKEALAKAMAKKADEERALIELRHHAWLDEQASKKQDIHQQKLDVSVSLDEWRAGRVVEDAVLQQQKLESSRILEQRRADWQALQQFKTSQIARDRQSLVERLGVWRCERTLEAQQKQALDEAEEIERELKAAELEDVKKYIEKQKQRDRESLCFRLGKVSSLSITLIEMNPNISAPRRTIDFILRLISIRFTMMEKNNTVRPCLLKTENYLNKYVFYISSNFNLPRTQDHTFPIIGPTRCPSCESSSE